MERISPGKSFKSAGRTAVSTLGIDPGRIKERQEVTPLGAAGDGVLGNAAQKTNLLFSPRHQCSPPFHQRLRVYAPAASWVFHNGGDGTLTDLSS